MMLTIFLGSIIGQVAPKPNTFMPFGNGVHSCPGNELAKLEILVLLHHLTTKYRYGSSNSNNNKCISIFLGFLCDVVSKNRSA